MALNTAPRAQVTNTMPRPLLLDTSTLQDTRAVMVAGPIEQRAATRPNKPLRLIKPANPAPLPISFNCCGDGRCGDLGCEGHPNNTGRADNSEHDDADPVYRQWTARFLVLWCAGWLTAALWFAFFR